MEEMRTRERKLEDQRHNLELSLSDAHQVCLLHQNSSLDAVLGLAALI
jgi:hypothetical protein